MVPDAGVQGVDGGPLPFPVTFATFNVRRFFDTNCSSRTCGPTAYEELPTPNEFNARADELAQAIDGLGADVVALEEVESQACIDALGARIGTRFPYSFLGETNAAASVDVAVVSRLPIDHVVRHGSELLTRPDGSQTTFARDFLEVHLEAGGWRFIAFAAHFRSKVDDDPGRRLAEAQTARRIVSAVAQANPDALVVMGGDLNDTPASPPLLALTEGDGGLRRVAADGPDGGDLTYFYRARGSAIDHLLLAPTNVGHYVAGSAAAFGPDTGYGGSDHRALRGRFLIGGP